MQIITKKSKVPLLVAQHFHWAFIQLSSLLNQLMFYLNAQFAKVLLSHVIQYKTVTASLIMSGS